MCVISGVVVRCGAVRNAAASFGVRRASSFAHSRSHDVTPMAYAIQPNILLPPQLSLLL